MDEDRLTKQLSFALEVDKEKLVLRQTRLSQHGRRENDAEHAWHMTLMAYLLHEYANEQIDLARTMVMTLTHDLVEIYAGDTYAYDTAGREDAHAREREAADRLFGLLPEDQGRDLRELWEEFERNQTPEARFAHAMDSLQPMMLNDANDGAGWREHGVARSQAGTRCDIIRSGSTRLGDYMDERLDAHVEAGNLRDA